MHVLASSSLTIRVHPGQFWPTLAILGHSCHHYSLVVHRKCSSKFLVLSIGKEMGLKERGGSLNRLWYSCFLVFNYLIFEGFCQITNIFHRLREILRSREYWEVASLKSPTMLQWIYAYFVQFFELWHWTKLEIRSFFGSVCTEVIPVFCPTCRVIVLKHHVH